MRILFLSHYYPPEVNAPASRTSEHCRAWVEAGHKVTVVTCAPNHPAGKLYPDYRNRLFQRETINGVDVVRVWTYLAANEGFLRRTLNYLSYVAGATLALPRLERPDVVISTSPQFFCGLTGLIARAVLRGPWVLEIRDIWPESIVTVGAMRKGLVVGVLERLERFAYRRADQIVAVTDSFVPHIAARCGDASKIDVIKNGVDLRLFCGEGSPEEAKHALGLEGKFVAAYVGTHGMAHGLDTVLDAAKLTADDQRIAWVLVGDGAERARLVERAAAEGLRNVHVLGQRPKSDMPMVWAATDVSMILLRRNDLFKKVLPSKMFEAMGMRRPIVLGVEGEAKELLHAAGAGIAITPESAEELAAAVHRLAAEPSLALSLADSGARYVREHFDRGRLAARYTDVLGRLLGRHSRQPGDIPVPDC
jgi:glycosyltransferase involved in cell wall biosynthesis